ncbi:thymidylate synthase, partial [bacterium]|nr:thymidylate synthase [bacterium]
TPKPLSSFWGPPLGLNQVETIIKRLRRKPHSRRAVIQLFEAEDIQDAHLDIPCTCSLQFMVRDRRLDMFTHMRSNDAYLGLPHDIFAFTMIQEIIARTLSIDIGTYKHFVGSLHLYDRNLDQANAYLDEGWQSTKKYCMPSMPACDPSGSIKLLLAAEEDLRLNGSLDLMEFQKLDPYWMDLIHLLRIFSHKANGDKEQIYIVSRDLECRAYKQLLDLWI